MKKPVAVPACGKSRSLDMGMLLPTEVLVPGLLTSCQNRVAPEVMCTTYIFIRARKINCALRTASSYELPLIWMPDPPPPPPLHIHTYKKRYATSLITSFLAKFPLSKMTSLRHT